MQSLRSLKNRIKLAIEISNIGPIARRYFVIGAFDGALTILGIIVGAYTVNELSKELVLAAGVAAGIALGVSSAVGAFEAERVESALRHLDLERAMLCQVEGGTRRDAMRFGNYAGAIIHGIAPLLAAFVPLVPFFFMEPEEAMLVAILVTLLFLFAMGIYLGSLIRETIVYTGLRFVVAGLGTAIILLLIGGH
ncbi:hypothetical protein E2P47_05795 [Candidatus Bathyarchaeota archaeon]|nr:hypothetical protein E2P47_05795 [Candidatus Bathyarchaeota archaeon]